MDAVEDIPSRRTTQVGSGRMLRALEDKAWKPALRRFRRAARLQFWTKVIFILGGAVVGAIGGGMDGTLLPSSGDGFLTLKGLLVLAGAFAVFFGGLVTIYVEDDSPEMLNAARVLSQRARDFLDDRDHLKARYVSLEKNADRVDRKRRERLLAIEQMCENVEAALLARANTVTAAQNMLKFAIHAIHKAVDYEGEDFFTITIFRRENRGEGERMYPIAADWTDPVKGEEDRRSWSAGKGYTGVAWARARDNPGAAVILADTMLPHIAQEYPVDDFNPQIEARYKSVAAIPILIGKTDNVWGVVTATVDRCDVFKRDVSALDTQNVEVVRDVARFAGLLAGLDRMDAK